MDPQPPIPMNPPPPTSTITTATSTTATEPPIPNHIAQVANPTLQHAPAPHHPPYAEMITAAIAALKERNGSSKKAIAKYIDRVYTNLPSTHSALLTNHLKRLKNNGQIVMVKHSYKLPPRSAAPSPSLNNAAAISAAAPLAQPKKRPGRPPKPKPISITPAQAQSFNVGFAHSAQNFVPIVGPMDNYNVTVGPTVQNEYQNFAVGPAPVVQKRKPGRPAKPKPGVTPLAQNVAAVPPAPQYVVAPPAVQNTTLPPTVAPGNGPVVGSEAMFVSLGLADGPAAAGAAAPAPAPAPVKRRPGRPRKGESAGPRQPRPKPLNQSGPKRKPGRPAKYGPGPNGVASVGLVSGKPRGRPKKAASAVVNGQPKRRGRRPKNVQPVSAVVPSVGVVVPQVEASGAVPNPVMVPYAQGPVAVPGGVPVAGNGVPPPAAGKRRGRPPRANGGPIKRRNPSGKPLGRPKKNVSPPDMQQHFSAFLDLQNKLDYLKLRIKQAVIAIKPCIEAGTSATAMGALQQLEELATVAVNDGPVNVQVEQAVQQV